jgi:Prokaryotic RING finger family 1
MTPGSPATSEMVGRTCPYCRFGLEEGVGIIACPVCKAVHHDDCWEENGGCAVALCAGGPSYEETPQEEAQQVEPPPPPAPAPTPPPLPVVVPPDPLEAPTQKSGHPPPPPGAPPPHGRPSRSRWIPLIAAAIVLLGGATAAAIVLTKHDSGSTETVSASASEAPPGSAEFDESEFEEEEEEFEEVEPPPPSPSQLAQGQIQHALRAHFNRLASGNYETAYYDLTSSEGEAIGGESAWVEAQEEDQLQSFNLTVDTSLTDPHSAQATIVEFETHALATGCNKWFGYWEMSKVYGEWLIGSAKLEKESC